TAPVITLIRVDFPAPFSPTSACTSPGRRSNDTPLSACTPAKDFVMADEAASGVMGEVPIMPRRLAVWLLRGFLQSQPEKNARRKGMVVIFWGQHVGKTVIGEIEFEICVDIAEDVEVVRVAGRERRDRMDSGQSQFVLTNSLPTPRDPVTAPHRQH